MSENRIAVVTLKNMLLTQSDNFPEQNPKRPSVDTARKQFNRLKLGNFALQTLLVESDTLCLC